MSSPGGRDESEGDSERSDSPVPDHSAERDDSTDRTTPSPPGPRAVRRRASVAAIQWGLIYGYVLDTVGRLFTNYYRATAGAAVPPDWVNTVRLAIPLGLLVGGVGGYRWVVGGRGSATAAAHRKRWVFVGALLAGGAFSWVPTVVLGDRLYAVPYFLVPTLVAVAVFAVAVALGYRVDRAWYRRRRRKLGGAVQGALGGFLVLLFGGFAYGVYTAAARVERPSVAVGLDGSLVVPLAVGVGAVAGYAAADSEASGDRAAEFVTVVLLAFFGATPVLALVALVVGVLGVPVGGVVASAVLAAGPFVLSVGVAGYLTWGARTDVHRLFV